MDGFRPFKPGGPLISILASNTSPTGQTLIGLAGDWSLLIDSKPVVPGATPGDTYLAYGPTSAVVSVAVGPTIGAPGTQNLVSIPAGSIQTFTFSGPTYFGGIGDRGQAKLDLLVGDGQ